MELDLQKRMELKELISEIAYLEKNTSSLCKYLFSKSGYDKIKSLYLMKDDALKMQQTKKAEEITKKIDNYAYLIAGLIIRLNSDPVLRKEVEASVPEFGATFKKLSDWVSENKIDQAVNNYLKFIEANKDKLDSLAKTDPFIKILAEKYEKERKR